MDGGPVRPGVFPVAIGGYKGHSALKLFLSYRRDGAAGWTGRLFDSLSAVFDANNIFMDVDSIPAGTPFEQLIQDSVVRADVILVVIGKNWVGATEKADRRIDRTSDYVRLEISTALKNRKRLIPVLVDSASPLQVEELPEDIAALAGRNAIELTHSRWTTTRNA
jgi:hypothetical protein